MTPRGQPEELTDRLWEEIVYIAYYLHWSFDSILELDRPPGPG